MNLLTQKRKVRRVVAHVQLISREILVGILNPTDTPVETIKEGSLTKIITALPRLNQTEAVILQHGKSNQNGHPYFFAVIEVYKTVSR